MKRQCGLRTALGGLSLLLVAPAALCGAEMDRSRAEPVTVVLTDYRFIPDHLTFRRGRPYRLHLENRGRFLHEFTAPAFLETLTVGNPEALTPDRREIVLQPGESKDLLFVPTARGGYDLTCADHDFAGMTGRITVE